MGQVWPVQISPDVCLWTQKTVCMQMFNSSPVCPHMTSEIDFGKQGEFQFLTTWNGNFVPVQIHFQDD